MSGSLRTSQVLALGSLIVSIIILIVILGFKKPDPNNMLVNRITFKSETEE